MFTVLKTESSSFNASPLRFSFKTFVSDDSFQVQREHLASYWLVSPLSLRTHRHTQPPACWWSSSPQMKLNLVLMKSSSPAASFTSFSSSASSSCLHPFSLADIQAGFTQTLTVCKKRNTALLVHFSGVVCLTQQGSTPREGLYQTDAASHEEKVNFFWNVLSWPITNTQTHIPGVLLFLPQALNQRLHVIG